MRIKRCTNRPNGYTLVELLIYMALMSVFILVLLDLFTATLNTKLSSESLSALSMDSRYVLAKLGYDINNSEDVTLPIAGESSASLTVTSSGVTSSYSLSNGDLIKTVSGVGMKLNGSGTKFENITFRNIGNSGGKPTVRVNFTIRSETQVNGQYETQTVNTTIGTR